ncbi:MAG: pantoate--beta-alanine ligase [Elusimicrobiota bacterium]|nr:pantoate--beta-alanine ligase [Elusimicrobiota bacterium]
MKTAPVIRTKRALAALVARWRREGRGVGFVPTMGALHEGHAALVRRAAAAHDRVVVSVFVNPLQFGPNEDYGRYPRALPADRRLVAAAGAAAVYAPTAREMYPAGAVTTVDPGPAGDLHCGAYRPGHFRGVATVVLKLFEQVRPDAAYFGEKDFQQVVIVERMVRDLDLPVRVVRVPTVRAKDGLALSSRNAYLTPRERQAAPALRRALRAGARAGRGAEKAVRRALSGTGLKLQYAHLVDADTLLAPGPKTRRRRLLAAAYLGRTRLIDNVALP